MRKSTNKIPLILILVLIVMCTQGTTCAYLNVAVRVKNISGHTIHIDSVNAIGEDINIIVNKSINNSDTFIIALITSEEFVNNKNIQGFSIHYTIQKHEQELEKCKKILRRKNMLYDDCERLNAESIIELGINNLSD